MTLNTVDLEILYILRHTEAKKKCKEMSKFPTLVDIKLNNDLHFSHLLPPGGYLQLHLLTWTF